MAMMVVGRRCCCNPSLAFLPGGDKGRGLEEGHEVRVVEVEGGQELVPDHLSIFVLVQDVEDVPQLAQLVSGARGWGQQRARTR